MMKNHTAQDFKIISDALIYILRAESFSHAEDGAVFWHYVVRRLRQKFQNFTYQINADEWFNLLSEKTNCARYEVCWYGKDDDTPLQIRALRGYSSVPEVNLL